MLYSGGEVLTTNVITPKTNYEKVQHNFYSLKRVYHANNRLFQARSSLISRGRGCRREPQRGARDLPRRGTDPRGGKSGKDKGNGNDLVTEWTVLVQRNHTVLLLLL